MSCDCNEAYICHECADKRDKAYEENISSTLLKKVSVNHTNKTKIEDYFEFHEKFCKEMTEITKKKNADYTGESGDPFSNFKLIEAFGAATTEQGLFARMTDKMSRISSFIQKGKLEVKDESVKDSLMDLANYCIIFAGYLESKKGG